MDRWYVAPDRAAHEAGSDATRLDHLRTQLSRVEERTAHRPQPTAWVPFGDADAATPPSVRASGEPRDQGPQASSPMIATLVRSIVEPPDRDATWNQLGDVVDA